MSNIDFRIRYRAEEETPTGLLFKYLRSSDVELSLRQRVLSALSAFWYPLACQQSGSHSQERLQAIARLSIQELRQQIKYLACTFGLEQELLQSGEFLGGDNYSTVRPAAAPERPEPAPVFSNSLAGDDIPQSDPELPQILWGNPEDDELLDAMFK